MRWVTGWVMLCTSAALAGAPSTVNDLKALASQQAWAELLERAEDVPAAERSDAWRTLVGSAATGVLDTADSSRASALAARYRFLSAVPAFAAAREALAQLELERCLDADGAACVDGWKKALGTPGADASLRAAKKVHHTHVPYAAVTLFAAAVPGKGAAACRDDDLAASTLAALALPSSDARVRDARRLAFELCAAALVPKVKPLMSAGSASVLENCCQPMRELKALTEVQADLCRDAEQ